MADITFKFVAYSENIITVTNYDLSCQLTLNARILFGAMASMRTFSPLMHENIVKRGKTFLIVMCSPLFEINVVALPLCLVW